MKKIYFSAILLVLFSVFTGCKKSVTIPSLTTSPVTAVTFTTATSGGDITSDGNASVTDRGVCWNTSSGPTISNSKTSDSNGTGQFVSNITGLTAATTYYVRAYATNSAGTAYGDEMTFSTSAIQPASVLTSVITSITTTTAVTGGNVKDDGGAAVTARGVCYGPNANPTITDTHTTNGADKGSFVSNLSGLTPSTLYHVRAYATNGAGTSYGSDITFTTATPQAANEVFIQGMAFSPATLTVAVNTTVKWTNNDGITHTVTSDTNLFNSGNIAAGGTYSLQFTSAGSFAYHCSIHPDMVATIIVQ